MGSAPRRRVKRFELLTDFTEWLLQSDASTIALIICSTKQVFLQKLCASVQLQMQREAQSTHEDGEPETIPAPPTTCHSLLADTIETIARSQRVSLAFCPRVDHLRAYLSVLRLPTKKGDTPGGHRYPGKPIIAILDPLAAHTYTSELSAQDLSRSLALAVEAGGREHADLYLCECRDPGDEDMASRSPWDIDIPHLNSSVGRVSEITATRPRSTVPARRIARRWFEFDKRE